MVISVTVTVNLNHTGPNKPRTVNWPTDRCWSTVDASKRHGRRVHADLRSPGAVQSAACSAAIYRRHTAHRRTRWRVHQVVVIVVEIGPQVLLSRHLTAKQNSWTSPVSLRFSFFATKSYTVYVMFLCLLSYHVVTLVVIIWNLLKISATMTSVNISLTTE